MDRFEGSWRIWSDLKDPVCLSVNPFSRLSIQLLIYLSIHPYMYLAISTFHRWKLVNINSDYQGPGTNTKIQISWYYCVLIFSPSILIPFTALKATWASSDTFFGVKKTEKSTAVKNPWSCLSLKVYTWLLWLTDCVRDQWLLQISNDDDHYWATVIVAQSRVMARQNSFLSFSVFFLNRAKEAEHHAPQQSCLTHFLTSESRVERASEIPLVWCVADPGTAQTSCPPPPLE